jgi:hypothetical protein
MPAASAAAGNNTFPTIATEREKQFKECLSYWDAGTHMSPTEWQAACRRTLNGRYF